MTQHHKHAPLTHTGQSKPTTLPNSVVAASGNGHDGDSTFREHIRLSAYQKWEAAGKPTGDGIEFWLEAEQELAKGKNEKFVQGDGWHEDREHERREAEESFKAANASVDSHYRDNNRMFQSHGERGHRHGGNG